MARLLVSKNESYSVTTIAAMLLQLSRKHQSAERKYRRVFFLEGRCDNPAGSCQFLRSALRSVWQGTNQVLSMHVFTPMLRTLVQVNIAASRQRTYVVPSDAQFASKSDRRPRCVRSVRS